MTHAPTKLVWMSDLHFVAEGPVLGHDPRMRVDAAVAHLNAHHDDADLCVISGDPVNRGCLGDYAALKTRPDRLVIPYRLMVVNHDCRTTLRQVFDMPSGCTETFVQYALPLKSGRVLCLDTLNPGADAGQLCPLRLQWLQNELAQAGDQPCLIFLHHPPMALGLAMQDRDGLAEGSQLLNLLAACGGPVHLFIGHVHRAICGTVRGFPFATMRSVLYQAPAPRPAWDWDSFKPADEAPNIGVIHVAGGDITLHYDQFCGAALGR